VFEQDQSESPEPSEKKISSVVLLAAGGVLVATVVATFASMLAGGAKPEAGPPKAKAEVEADQPASTSTSLSVAPDGSTSTVLITVPGKPRGEQARNAGGPVDGSSGVAEVVVTQTVVPASEQVTTRAPVSVVPSGPASSSAPVSSSVVPSETSSVVPTVSGDPKP